MDDASAPRNTTLFQCSKCSYSATILGRSRRQHRCPHCQDLEAKKREEARIDELEKEIKRRGGVMITPADDLKKIVFQCHQKVTHRMTVEAFEFVRTCSCDPLIVEAFEKLSTKATKKGWKVLDTIDVYTSPRSVITFQCPKLHVGELSASAQLVCKECTAIKNFNIMTRKLSKRQWAVISDHKAYKSGSESVLTFQCSNGHEVTKSLSSLKKNFTLVDQKIKKVRERIVVIEKELEGIERNPATTERDLDDLTERLDIAEDEFNSLINSPNGCDDCVFEWKYRKLVATAERCGFRLEETFDTFKKVFETHAKYLVSCQRRDHLDNIDLKNLSRLNGCRKCSGAAVTNQEKHQILSDYAQNFGWKLLSPPEDCRGAKHKLNFLSPDGHDQMISPKNFMRTEKFCRVCSGATVTNQEKHQILSDYTQTFGWKLLSPSDDYRGEKHELNFLSPDGHEQMISPKNFMRTEKFCRFCGDPRVTEARSRVKELLIGAGCTNIGDYINSKVNIQYVAPCGHLCEVRPDLLIPGRGICPHCAKNNPTAAKERFHDYVERMGGKVIGEYRSSKTPVECLCKNDHKCYFALNNIYQGICLQCVNHCPKIAKKNFFDALDRAKFTYDKSVYVDTRTPVSCICPLNHHCSLLPTIVQQRGVYCTGCAKAASYLEEMTEGALKCLGVQYEKQYRSEFIKRLKFDFFFVHNGLSYYIEVDGPQHHKYLPFFHRFGDSFYKSRQRDLVKNYFVMQSEKSVLIRLDHEMFERRDPSFHDDEIAKLAKYIESCFQCGDDEKVICNRSIYTWIDQQPAQATINEYILSRV
ncbi:Hypothetical protein POVR1_LOCUS112 [uncultured virus]|nr:Hypothetical protein POVR1_LOCUS112 [uncultured virus]